MKKLILLCVLCFSLNACVETIVVGAIATGVIVAQEKTAGQTKNDLLIFTKINQKLAKIEKNNEFKNVEVKVYEGRVILLGKVPNKKTGKKVVDTAWNTKGVKEVANETIVYINKHPSKVKYASSITKDAIINSRVKTKLAMKKEIKAINYDVETIDGTVYLMGVAQNKRELEKSTKIASRVRGVKKVVSHVVLKNDNRR
jgi:osmotically-inducible protein OsmY